ncbi:hypothetical protein [Mesorhizobium sp.]|uniref:hypothetical protein n=1 Tax=Mesorhizobium sp. TaxID=1871066 RepID=UPI000FE3A5CA|nr:hypothetical protein [Mesorhizobium sp.]RWN58957.1 MAG: hypothetical protein EOR98_00660 [Mesorhizobium sp.]RWN80466.1 MAG: hypothetical protein EOS02_00660 [Mesorhizobium sp.]RWN83751.1 MAG: hypothetical protein EOS01_05685 [Mesorhizobium sp.]RWN87500.1 MAG: hypothetical protein EOS04_14420 [Mesorhizobium sp.]RWO16823.1 MAG: hypothetical protein EOS15_07720 [Mesorhizobium sp.]
MRSFTPKTLRTATLAALLVTVPLAGADAGPHDAALINQIESVDTGIRAAKQANSVEPNEARDLRTQVAQLDRAAQRAARDGTMPATLYHKMLAQIDRVSQRLRAATGSAFLIGSGGDGGYYPNGYGPNYPKG